MRSAAQAYGQVAKQIASPRKLEANLLLQAAARLQAVRDAASRDSAEFDGALRFNRKLWSVFLATVTNPENPLPPAIRQNVANLGLFVMKHTIDLTVDPKPERLRVLIDINREVAAGLMGRA